MTQILMYTMRERVLVDAIKNDPFVVTLIEKCEFHEKLLEDSTIVRDMEEGSFEDFLKGN